ncbi:MAG: transcriptional repressor [Cyclobacteriaceae bacterium]|nr:transcriptional repressor [Cyclobacteriaceae bacterium]
MVLEEVTKALSAKGLKITHQRIVVFKALLSSPLHPTAEQIYDGIKKDNPAISVATVYKTLETLVENQLINKVPTPEGTMRYDARIDNHNHIYISNTNEIMDYEDEELKGILAQYLSKKKFQNLHITDFKLQIKGEKIDPGKGINII